MSKADCFATLLAADRWQSQGAFSNDFIERVGFTSRSRPEATSNACAHLLAAALPMPGLGRSEVVPVGLLWPVGVPLRVRMVVVVSPKPHDSDRLSMIGALRKKETCFYEFLEAQ